MTDNSKYGSILTVIYNDAAKPDHTKLIDHYKPISTRTNENSKITAVYNQREKEMMNIVGMKDELRRPMISQGNSSKKLNCVT